MTDNGAALGAIIDAIDAIDGVRLAVPVGAQAPEWWPWDARGFAVDLAPELVEVRVIASMLPLAPLLEKASVDLRAALDGTEWSQSRLRLVVTELDAGAFDQKVRARGGC